MIYLILWRISSQNPRKALQGLLYSSKRLSLQKYINLSAAFKVMDIPMHMVTN